MSKEEEFAWKEYYNRYFTSQMYTPDEAIMYRLCFLAGYRAAQHRVQRMGLLARISKWFGAIAHR